MSAKWQSSLKGRKKTSRVQNKISQTFEKDNEEAYSTESKKSQIALIKSKLSD